jgi:hypothetical protein
VGHEIYFLANLLAAEGLGPGPQLPHPRHTDAQTERSCDDGFLVPWQRPSLRALRVMTEDRAWVRLGKLTRSRCGNCQFFQKLENVYINN